MKKLTLFIMAAVLAIGFSAFTPAKKPVDAYYSDGSSWQPYTGALCPTTPTPFCYVKINGVARRLFFTPSTDFPVPGPNIIP
jgi:hypothetical protein